MHVKITGQCEGHFSEGSRSPSKVMSYSLTGRDSISDGFIFQFHFVFPLTIGRDNMTNDIH